MAEIKTCSECGLEKLITHGDICNTCRQLKKDKEEEK